MRLKGNIDLVLRFRSSRQTKIQLFVHIHTRLLRHPDPWYYITVHIFRFEWLESFHVLPLNSYGKTVNPLFNPINPVWDTFSPDVLPLTVIWTFSAPPPLHLSHACMQTLCITNHTPTDTVCSRQIDRLTHTHTHTSLTKYVKRQGKEAQGKTHKGHQWQLNAAVAR